MNCKSNRKYSTILPLLYSKINANQLFYKGKELIKIMNMNRIM